LEEAVKNPVVTVVAGAGYGKTFAVYNFLRNHDAVTTWLQLSDRDNLCSRFWENYTHTLSLYNEPVAKKFREIGFPETDSDFEKFLVAARDWLLPNKKYVLVLDDLHLINNADVLRFIEKRISTTMFLNLTVILLSRTELPISISGMLFKRIDESDLRFTERELAEYLHLLRHTVSTEIIANTYQDTEGWPFAVNLLGMSLERSPGHTTAARTTFRRNISKLIENEILASISERLQRFLVRISLIDHLALDLIHMLANDAELVSEMLNISSYFYIRFDTYLHAFLIHPLVLDCLRKKQNMLTEEEKHGTYSIAAKWCRENDYFMDAIAYYEKVGEYEEIVHYVFNNLHNMPITTTRFIMGLLENASAESVRDIVLFPVTLLRIKIHLGMLDEAFDLSKRYMEHFTALPETPSNNRIIASLYAASGITRLLMAPHTDCYDFDVYFAKQDEYFSRGNYETTDTATVHYVGPWISKVGTDRYGAMEEYIESLSRTVRHASHAMGGRMSGMDDLAKGELFFFKNDIKMAERFVMQALASATEKKQYDIKNKALYYLIRISLAQGNFAKIEQATDELKTQLTEKKYVIRYITCDTVMAWYNLALGYPQYIADWLKADCAPNSSSKLMGSFKIIIKAKYYYALREYHALLAFLTGNRDRESILFGKIESKALEAVCQYQLKNKDDAFTTLREAYEMALSNNLTMPFIELGKDMRTLTGSAMLDSNCAIPREWLETINKKSSTYAKRLAIVQLEYKKANHFGDKIVELSDREMEVLADLHQGLSRPEIASNHNLSINTVKLIVSMIYSKLGASNVAGAIHIATERNLLK
jgi:LuxR family maltose regulon positive regulatory protein